MANLNTESAETVAVGDQFGGRDEYITTKELSQRLRISAATIWRLHRAGKLDGKVKIGHSTRWRWLMTKRGLDAQEAA